VSKKRSGFHLSGLPVVANVWAPPNILIQHVEPPGSGGVACELRGPNVLFMSPLPGLCFADRAQKNSPRNFERNFNTPEMKSAPGQLGGTTREHGDSATQQDGAHVHANHSTADVNRKHPNRDLQLFEPREVAASLCVSEKTLARWRSEQTGGPHWVKVGRLVRYRAADVAAYVESRIRGAGHDR